MFEIADLGVLIFVIVVSYLIGSLPTAYLLGRLRNINIFEVGSGNMGGTNVARSMGTGWGILTAVFDILKGVVAVLLARLLMPDMLWLATTVSAIVVVVGHNWSLFASLLVSARKGYVVVRGGKGAATTFGTLLVIAPVQVIIVMMAVGGFVLAGTRYMSLGVLVSFGLAFVWVALLVFAQQLPAVIIVYTIAMAIMMAVRFRDNIQRLLAGNERKVGDSA
jgi:acyl phosphate:glycerol-3-phosphate acyltransferase